MAIRANILGPISSPSSKRPDVIRILSCLVLELSVRPALMDLFPPDFQERLENLSRFRAFPGAHAEAERTLIDFGTDSDSST